ncbi:MAG TPA: DUF3105 domain-containing protein [Candidatus Limnocylindria bacterium]|nr:DUF3105 domain-containing protein [Candidatus Limnocylindria bacterium]
MATSKRRTSGVQRRGRASDAAMQRRVNQRGGAMPIDWRLLIVGGVLVLGVIVLVIVLVFGGSSGPRVGTPMPDEGATHVDQSTFPTYQSRPATSGPHWNLGDGVAPVFWGVYTSPVAEPAVVHNLEHGGIVIWYQDTATADDIQKLTQFTEQAQSGSNFKVVLSPWAGEDFGHPIAVTAWDWLLYLDTADIDQIRAFQDDHPTTDAPEPAGGPAQGAR